MGMQDLMTKQEQAHTWLYKFHIIPSYEGKPRRASFKEYADHVLNPFGLEEAPGEAKFYIILDMFFNCLNLRNTTEHTTKRKLLLKPHY